MCELIVRLKDVNPEDDKNNVGDILCVLKDGTMKGKNPPGSSNPPHTYGVIKLPGVPVSVYKPYEKPVLKDGIKDEFENWVIKPEVIKKRRYQIPTAWVKAILNTEPPIITIVSPTISQDLTAMIIDKSKEKVVI